MRRKYEKPQVTDFYLVPSCDILKLSLDPTPSDGAYVEWPGNSTNV
ncbi:MAG: hypothetical protein IJ038_06555 [Clostridia bacterium]|nr:hypothetical protein [Clostridia bacterium]